MSPTQSLLVCCGWCQPLEGNLILGNGISLNVKNDIGWCESEYKRLKFRKLPPRKKKTDVGERLLDNVSACVCALLSILPSHPVHCLMCKMLPFLSHTLWSNTQKSEMGCWTIFPPSFTASCIRTVWVRLLNCNKFEHIAHILTACILEAHVVWICISFFCANGMAIFTCPFQHFVYCLKIFYVITLNYGRCTGGQSNSITCAGTGVNHNPLRILWVLQKIT